MKPSKAARGFSLVETLVVIGILAVLAALIFAVLVPSRRKAREADVLSRLRQLGAAASLYEQNFGVHPLGSGVLVATGYAPESICESPLDAAPRGLANEVAHDNGRLVSRGVTPFRRSFPDLTDFGTQHSQEFKKFIVEESSGGWLIDTDSMEKNELWMPAIWKGRFRRLQFDGAVVSSYRREVPCGGDSEAKVSPCWPIALFFMDPSPEYLEWLKLQK
jgi:prepilin-type N-terminal cleavage/methylation domain-containing protein